MSTSKKCIENEVGQKKSISNSSANTRFKSIYVKIFLHMNSIFEPKILYFVPSIEIPYYMIMLVYKYTLYTQYHYYPLDGDLKIIFPYPSSLMYFSLQITNIPLILEL